MVMKKFLISFFVLLILLVLISFGGGYYLIDVALVPKNAGEKDLVESYKVMCKEYPYIKPWADSLKSNGLLKDIYKVDGKDTIHAYYIEANQVSNKTAVVVHGYTDNAIRIFQIAYMYHHDLGYNVLIPDLKYHGLSQGESIQMGWKDRLQVEDWMDSAHKLWPNSNMLVHGISMGAATTMMVSGDIQDSYVKCFIEDCGYTSVWDQFSKELKEDYGMPSFPILNCANLICNYKYGWDFKEASALEQVRKSTLPIFFIHGNIDTYVPTHMVYSLYKAKKGEKKLWVVKDAKHAVSYQNNKEEYTRRVEEFTEKYMN